MTSLCPSALASLDESLEPVYEGLRQLEAAKFVDLAELIKQFKAAEGSARNLRAVVSAELPNASWENREELDALIGDKAEPNTEKVPRSATRWHLPFARWARAR